MRIRATVFPILSAKQQCLEKALKAAEGTTFGFAGTVSLMMGFIS